ncbi:MAG: hypothetical protein KIS87_14160 [Phycisphaeraceae bacterium]|nr:hypothetical protein [Phycisphaeraceae bacterium]
MKTARLVDRDGYQTVCFPPGFRIEGDAVSIRRLGRAVLLRPVDSASGLFRETLGDADDDFMPDRLQPETPESRPEL